MPKYFISTTETVSDHLTNYYEVEAESLEEVLDLFDSQGFATSRFYDKGLDPVDTKTECGDSHGNECLERVRVLSHTFTGIGQWKVVHPPNESS